MHSPRTHTALAEALRVSRIPFRSCKPPLIAAAPLPTHSAAGSTARETAAAVPVSASPTLDERCCCRLPVGLSKRGKNRGKSACICEETRLRTLHLALRVNDDAGVVCSTERRAAVSLGSPF